jgi:nitrate/TMAO reductase-like tetraheme cytochrome c subunit
MKLTIELVPKSSWYSNLRSELTKSEWDKIKKKTREKSGNKCEICGGVGPKWPVECHEIWEYDDINNVQILIGIQALCPDCHQVKHFGLAEMKGHYNKALRHLAKVNNIILEEAGDYVEACFDVWEKRSKKQWKLNTDWIDGVLND